MAKLAKPYNRVKSHIHSNQIYISYNNHVVIRIIIRKPKSKSLVWTYFGLEADDMTVPLPGKEDKPIRKILLAN